ncbi:MAG: hypothetical protein D6E12_08080 [Desulfovibrio sp.]|nr:MAG: hypothetical protein D6E12_08080 [Desulfovibrio sp.]
MLVLVVLWAGMARAGQVAWLEYSNARFGYIFFHPVYFEPQPEADNGDGRRFLAPEYEAEASAWGSVLLAPSLENEFQQVQGYLIQGGASVTYSSKGEDWFVLSGYAPDGRIYYRRTILQDGMLASFILTYPEVHKNFFAPVVELMAMHLRFAE